METDPSLVHMASYQAIKMSRNSLGVPNPSLPSLCKQFQTQVPSEEMSPRFSASLQTKDHRFCDDSFSTNMRTRTDQKQLVKIPDSTDKIIAPLIRHFKKDTILARLIWDD